MFATMERMVVTGLRIICNTLFMKQESKCVTYIAGSTKSTVGYIMVRQGDKVKVRIVKVIPKERCRAKA